MPTYEYVCDACHHEFEKFHSMSAAPIKKCPECGKNKVTRKIGTGAGIIFKGGGFYETDYRGGSYQKAADADKAPSGDAKTDTKADATKSEAKPETKAETKSETKSESTPAPAKTESKSAKKPVKSSKKA